MLKWASASTNSATPVTRIRYQTTSSRREPLGPHAAATDGRDLDRLGVGLGVGHATSPSCWSSGSHTGRRMMSAPGTPTTMKITQLAHHRLAVIDGHARPEVDDDDPQAVQRVVQQRRAEHDLQQPPGDAGVEREHLVIQLRVAADEVDVDHVQDDEGEDADAADAMEGPREHALAAAVAQEERDPTHALLAVALRR